MHKKYVTKSKNRLGFMKVDLILKVLSLLSPKIFSFYFEWSVSAYGRCRGNLDCGFF
jgi:hypothetical protein